MKTLKTHFLVSLFILYFNSYTHSSEIQEISKNIPTKENSNQLNLPEKHFLDFSEQYSNPIFIEKNLRPTETDGILYYTDNFDGPCGGVTNCPLVNLPFPPGNAQSEISPNKLQVSGTCYNPSGRIVGAVQLEELELLIFTSNSAAIDVLDELTYTQHPISGNTIMCAGAICKGQLFVHEDAAIAITESHINILKGGTMVSRPLPAGFGPSAVVWISNCQTTDLNVTVYIETNQPSIEVVSPLGIQTSFTIPASLAATSVSWNNGSLQGVIAFSQNSVYKIEGGVMTPQALPGNFINYQIVSGTSLIVNTTSGQVIIPLPGCNIETFGVCTSPMDACNNIPSTIAFNIEPCVPNVNAVNAAWIAPLGCANELNFDVSGIGPNYIPEHKDTKMLCISDSYVPDLPNKPKRQGCNELVGDIPGPWDEPHPIDHACFDCDHCSNYSGQACIAMVNHFYGGDLSQDEISYMATTLNNEPNLGGHSFRSKLPEYVSARTPGGFPVEPSIPPDGPNPEQDLSHGKELEPFEMENGINWSLELVDPDLHANVFFGAPTMQFIKEEIQNNRPIIIEDIHFHKYLIVGYFGGYIYGSINIFFEVKIVDPDPCGYTGWVDYEDIDANVITYCELPEIALVGRHKNLTIDQDPDLDGIVTFDEVRRFYTDPTKKDFDKDEVNDKQEIRRYTFHESDGEHVDDNWDVVYFDDIKAGCRPGKEPLPKRPERDCDSDEDGTFDGGEDINGNGRLSAGEIDPLDVCNIRNNCPIYQKPMVEIHTDDELCRVKRYLPNQNVILKGSNFHANSSYGLSLLYDCGYPPVYLPNNLGIITTDNNGNVITRNLGTFPVGSYNLVADILNDGEYRGRYNFDDNIDPEICFEIVDSTQYQTVNINENFSSSTFPPTGWSVTGFYWSRDIASSYGLGVGSAKFDSWNAPNNTIQSLITPVFTPTSAGDSIKFDHAFAPYCNGCFLLPNDSLIIETSTNGGNSFQALVRLWGDGIGGPLNTAPAVAGPFTPTSSQWATKQYALPSGVDKIMFRARSGLGNNLYLDEIIVKRAPSTISNITVVPEGFLNPSNNFLNMKDRVWIYLREITPPYLYVDVADAQIDSLTLNASVTFEYAPSGTYYLTVLHRNSIETWSKAGGQVYTRGTVFNYNFTTSQVQAYGSNMVHKGTKWCIYNGDVNQDGIIDGSDLIIVDNAAFNYTSGYNAADVTGDNYVDASDISIVDNNANNNVGVIKPLGAGPLFQVNNVSR